MLHKPTQRKLPKKYDNSQQEQEQAIHKLASKPVIQNPKLPSVPNANVRGRVNKVEKKIDKVTGSLNNAQLQALLID